MEITGHGSYARISKVILFSSSSINISGTSKINVVISNWPFCGKVTCKQGDNYVLGEYLDLTIAVRGISPAGEEDREENHGSSFGVGSGKIVFSDKVDMIL